MTVGKKQITLLVLALLFVILITPSFTFGQEQGVVLLETLPGVGSEGDRVTNVGAYLAGIFQLGIGIAAALAVVMIVIGGVKYMTSESFSQKSDGREMVLSALGGLVLAIAAVLILQTINPALVRFDFIETLSEVEKQSGEQVTRPDSENPLIIERSLREQLSARGIDSVLPCSSGARPCADLRDLPQRTLDTLVSLAEECNCGRIIITGGAETSGHTTHGPGKPFIDVDDNNNEFNSWLANQFETKTILPGGTLITFGNHEALLEETHWHLCLNSSCEVRR